jgi:peptide/nickel transport system substrate-binding protein
LRDGKPYLGRSDAEVSRRRLLHLCAAAAGGAMLAACSPGSGSAGQPSRKPTGTTAPDAGGRGSATKPLPTPTSFQEAPLLAAQVKAGGLPPVAERLPKNPYVVPHRWLTPGKYGGKLRLASSATDSAMFREYMYGYSIIRWLNDGLDIGPGLAESWETNDDATEWTFRFRTGLRWSDGAPWTTDDIMFWWNDLVLNEAHSETAPDETRSANGKLMELTAPDDVTLVMRFETPAPLTPFHLARWVNGGIGPGWMVPKHYLKQFHPTYNAKVSDDWASADGEFERRRNWSMNPACPTMTGWRLKTYSEGRQVDYERNPYYWCVDSDGRQLPFIDTVTIAAVKDPQVLKLQIQAGKFDNVDGYLTGAVTLSDVSSLKQTQQRSKLEVLLWDSGDGTGSLFFLNYDYREPAMRELIRKPEFRQALSYAFNRADAQKSMYFDTGERTTGTYSPKSLDFLANDDAKGAYRQWRDSYVSHDPAKAEAMLDELGVVDADGDGKRELPGGGKLVLRLDYQADSSAIHLQKNNLLKRDWERIGLTVQINPVPPESFAVDWDAGKLMSTTAWEMGGGIHEILVEPQVLVPLQGFSAWWAPLHANFHAVWNTPGAAKLRGIDPYERTPPSVEPEPGGPIERLWQLYDQAKTEPDALRRYSSVWEMIKIHVSHGPFFMGAVANFPRVVLAHEDLRNVPRRENLRLGGFCGPWSHPNPAVYDPETWYWASPEAHG